MQEIWEGSQWYSDPPSYWTLKYECRRTGDFENDVEYRFYWKVWIGEQNYWYHAFTLRLFLNGKQYNVKVKDRDTSKGWSYEGTTEWYKVSNKIDGTVPFYAQMYNDSDKVVKATSKSFSLNVPTARAIILTAQDFTDEQNPTITYKNPLGNGVDALDICISFDCINDHIKYRPVSKTGTSYTFNFTEEEREVLRNATPNEANFLVHFFLRTTVGEEKFYAGWTKTLTIVNANPIFTEEYISVADENKVLYGITKNEEDNQKIVQKQSSLAVIFQAAEGIKGAYIDHYMLTLNGVTKTVFAEAAPESGTVSFGIINSSQELTLSVTVTDSRGFSTTVEKNIGVLEWSMPTFTAKVERVNNYEDETDIVIDVSISSVDDKNYIKSIKYQVMEVGGSYGVPVAIAENVKSYNDTATTSVTKEKDFFFLITVEDAFDYDNKEFYLPKGKFPLFIDTENSSVGINEFPEEGEALRVAGGVARFDDGIVLVTASKRFLLSVDDSGKLNITEIKQGG